MGEKNTVLCLSLLQRCSQNINAYRIVLPFLVCFVCLLQLFCSSEPSERAHSSLSSFFFSSRCSLAWITTVFQDNSTSKAVLLWNVQENATIEVDKLRRAFVLPAYIHCCRQPRGGLVLMGLHVWPTSVCVCLCRWAHFLCWILVKWERRWWGLSVIVLVFKQTHTNTVVDILPAVQAAVSSAIFYFLHAGIIQPTKEEKGHRCIVPVGTADWWERMRSVERKRKKKELIMTKKQTTATWLGFASSSGRAAALIEQRASASTAYIGKTRQVRVQLLRKPLRCGGRMIEGWYFPFYFTLALFDVLTRPRWSQFCANK